MREVRLTAGQVPDCDITFTLSEPIAEGSLIRVRTNYLPPLNAMYVTDASGRAGGMEIVHRFSMKQMREGDWKWHIDNHSLVMFRANAEFEAGDEIRLTWEKNTADGKTTEPTSDVAGITWKFTLGTVDTLRSDDLRVKAESFGFTFTEDRADRMEAYLKRDGTVCLQYFDTHGNAAVADSSSVTISVDDEMRTFPVESRLNANVFRVNQPRPRPGLAGNPALTSASRGTRITIEDNLGRKAVSNHLPISSLTGEAVLFGEIHWHSEFSGDGQRDLTEAMTTARYQYNLDFAGPADHINGIEYYRSREFGLDRQEEIMMPFYEEGAFVPIVGAEISGGYGHINYYGRDFDAFRQMTERAREAMALAFTESRDRFPLKQLQQACLKQRTMYGPHHSNTNSFLMGGVVDERGRPKWNAIYFPLPASDYPDMRFFEMVQGRGSFETETYQDGWRMSRSSGGCGGSARTGLMRGYRFGFIGGTDNHAGWPTRGGSGYTGCTGVVTNDFTMGGIFDAIYNRRSYATTGARIVADYSVSGHPMGSEIKGGPEDRRVFDIEIHGTAGIETVEIIHGGFTLAVLETDGSPDFRRTWEDDRPGRPLEDAWYYVRARQVDGECLWMSPVWFDLAEDNQ